MDIKYIEKLAKLIKETQLTELSVKDGEQTVTLKKEAGKTVEVAQVMPQIQKSQPVQPKEEKVEAPVKKSDKVIKSPMVGTFYKAPAAGAPPRNGAEAQSGRCPPQRLRWSPGNR